MFYFKKVKKAKEGKKKRVVKVVAQYDKVYKPIYNEEATEFLKLMKHNGYIMVD
jgi:hypothetical protein